MPLPRCCRCVRWLFGSIWAHCIQPNVCVLLDVGTRPGNNSIYRLWKAFDVNSSVGGACGEIATYKGKNWSLLLNPLGEHLSLSADSRLQSAFSRGPKF